MHNPHGLFCVPQPLTSYYYSYKIKTTICLLEKFPGRLTVNSEVTSQYGIKRPCHAINIEKNSECFQAGCTWAVLRWRPVCICGWCAFCTMQLLLNLSSDQYFGQKTQAELLNNHWNCSQPEKKLTSQYKEWSFCCFQTILCGLKISEGT